MVTLRAYQAAAEQERVVAHDTTSSSARPGRAVRVSLLPVLRLLAGRWQGGRLGYPLDNLGIRARLALRQHLLDKLDRALDLLRRHVLDRIAMFDFVFARHEQDKQFQKYRRLVPHHLLYRLAAAATEGKMHLADGVGVERMTRTLGVSAKVS